MIKMIMLFAMILIVEVISVLTFILYKSFSIDLYLSYLIVGLSTLAIGILFVWITRKDD